MTRPLPPLSTDPATSPAPLLVTTREAARLLSVSERTLWSLAASGAIRRLKVGASVRFPVAELQRWIDHQMQAQAPEAGDKRTA